MEVILLRKTHLHQEKCASLFAKMRTSLFANCSTFLFAKKRTLLFTVYSALTGKEKAGDLDLISGFIMSYINCLATLWFPLPGRTFHSY